MKHKHNHNHHIANHLPVRERRLIQHRWDVTPVEAIGIQEQLRHLVITEDRLPPIRRVGGVDVHFDRDGKRALASVAVLSFPELRPEGYALAGLSVTFPYLPGLLSFRELPPVLAALARLSTLPDLLLCDGQGLAHPRRFGMACHLGVIAGIPTIGVAKTRLLGNYPELPEERGSWSPLCDRGEIVGAVLRSRARVKPLFVSVGHRVSLSTAIRLVLDCAPRHRLPETTRIADHLARRKYGWDPGVISIPAL
jgi:deoxyribonuclease V